MFFFSSVHINVWQSNPARPQLSAVDCWAAPLWSSEEPEKAVMQEMDRVEEALYENINHAVVHGVK